jgi:hypothetical protein
MKTNPILLLVVLVVVSFVTQTIQQQPARLTCTGSGDPHIRTWANYPFEMFNIQESVLIQSPRYSVMMRTLKYVLSLYRR